MGSTNSFGFSLLFALVLGACGASPMPFFLFPKNCFAENCQENGFEIETSLNYSRDPCTEFYKCVCDNWSLRAKKPKSEPYWSQYLATTYQLNGKLQETLDKHIADDTNAKIFYKNCVDGGNEEKYTRQLRNFVEKLGGWRNFSYLDYEPLRHVAEVTRLLGVHPILKFHVNTDYTNTTQNILYMEPGDFIFPKSLLVNHERHQKELKIYRVWIRDTLAQIYDRNPSSFDKEVENVIEFEIELAKITLGEDTIRNVPVRNLPIYDQTYWNNIFGILLQNTKFQHYSIEKIVSKPIYLKKLFELIAKTHLHTISNYVIWSAIKDLARETSATLRKINFLVDNQLLHNSEDLDRRHECVQHALKYFEGSLTDAYVRNYLDERVVRNVERIAESIRTEFVGYLEKNDWLSAKMKKWVVEKVLRIRFEIGFPKHRHAEYTKELSSNHLLNTLRLKSFLSKSSLERLNDISKEIKWPNNAFEVNAYYSILQNAMILPLGILSPPFYDPRRPEALNYGAMGTLIGHEISHALDTDGRMGDKNGVVGDWWDKEDSEKFEEKSECFKERYNRYGVDGSFTVGENVADNVGLQLSFGAMMRNKQRGISTFHKKKLFFISFGQLWCETSSDGDLFMEEVHSPVEIRVLATLSNFDPFNYIYDCKQGNVCKLW